MNLPMIPTPSTALTISDVISIEREIANQITTIENVDALEEMRAKAEALARYLSGKELHGPMLGAQRRIEARIGQLLGDTFERARTDLTVTRELQTNVSRMDRNRFRTLARGFEVLTDEEWRQSRKKVIALIFKRSPMPRRTPEHVVTTSGAERKAYAQRLKEVSTLAADGHRAAQIAEKLKITREQVRNIATRGGVKLPDDDIGRGPRINPARVLRETITGIEAYADGLSILDSIDLPAFEAREQAELLQSLSRSINALRKLHSKMRLKYGRPEGSDAATA